MKLSAEQELFAINVSKLIDYIYVQGYACTFGEAFRTPEQAAIYAKEGKGIEDSLHCKRLAIDLNIFDGSGTYLSDTESYKPFGDYWVTLHPNNRWGGSFKHRPDGNHFQMQDLG